MGGEVDLASKRAVGSHSPMFRAAEFVLLLQALQLLPPPCRIRRNAKTLSDDAIDFIAQKQLVHCELSLRIERCYRFVANFEERGARDRILVVFDLVLDVQIVFVLERSGRRLIHQVGTEVTQRAVRAARKLEHSVFRASVFFSSFRGKMPELPEVEEAMQRLKKAVEGKTIAKAKALHPAIARQSPDSSARRLRQQR